ncbi:MAG: phosphoenolpyruvate mutase [Alphaproteobacteria bacterium]
MQRRQHGLNLLNAATAYAGEADTPKRTKAGMLRAELLSPELSFLMEAHDGLSAKIVEEAGFHGIWASGLSVSAALGLRDNNEASWTQVLEVLEFMSDATRIPILVDGDTGYGNFNNMRRLVKKLCQRQIAGVCIEDKVFPKANSFVGEAQPLAEIDEFCGKIKAGKDSQTDDDFCIIARVEALVSGWGLDEALGRAEAYHAAGADAVLVHSKQSTADEVLAFAREWGDRCPIVIVPTMFYVTPTDAFRKAKISTVIWANHTLRAAITAMQDVCRRVLTEESLVGIEGEIATVQEVFRLTGNKELADAERRYLGGAREETHAIVIAASRGDNLGELTQDRPKCMIDIRGKPLLRRLVSTMRKSGVRSVTVVRGYKKEAIDLPSIDAVDNDAYGTTGEAASLACAIEALDGSCVLSYGDILFRRYILDALLAARGDIVMAVDALGADRLRPSLSRTVDFVSCSRRFTGNYLLEKEPAFVTRIANDLPAEEVTGEWIGLARLSPVGSALIRDEIEAMRADGSLAKASLVDLFARLLAKGAKISTVYIAGNWLDVDDVFDLAEARNFL